MSDGNRLIDRFALDAVANKFEIYGNLYEHLERHIKHYEDVKEKRKNELCHACNGTGKEAR